MVLVRMTRHCPANWTQCLVVLLISLSALASLKSAAASRNHNHHHYQLNGHDQNSIMAFRQLEFPQDLKVKTQVPVIGVLTEVLRDYKRFVKVHKLHIAASYIKWLESAGAQVVPVLLNQDESYYKHVIKHTNGLLFPGGDNLLDPSKNTPMMVAAKLLYKYAVKANNKGDYYPIWGTCLGLELMSVLTANRNVLENCSATDDPLAMEFVERGKMFAPTNYADLPGLSADYSGAIVEALSGKNLTYNYHSKCLTDAGLKEAGLDEFYKPLAYSRDKNNLKFIAIFEAKRYPFFGVQFHPEKPPFEFVIKNHQVNIPHSRAAIAVSRYFADFFVQQAQLNGHDINRKKVENLLIYAHNPLYTAPMHDMYEQRYLFPFGDVDASISTEEFIEHVPGENEKVPEDVSKAGRLGLVEDDAETLRETQINLVQLGSYDDGGLLGVSVMGHFIDSRKTSARSWSMDGENSYPFG